MSSHVPRLPSHIGSQFSEVLTKSTCPMDTSTPGSPVPVSGNQLHINILAGDNDLMLSHPESTLAFSIKSSEVLIPNDYSIGRNSGNPADGVIRA